MTAVPATGRRAPEEALVRLRDGSQVRIHQCHSSDKELLRGAFEHLSLESRYMRFLTPMPALPEKLLRYLADIDHHNHEAMIATDARTGEGVGVARYVRDANRPDMADVAVTVIDNWQGRGLGTVLLELISARARDEGITTFTAIMLGTNRSMMDLFRHLSDVRVVDREAGAVRVELPLPDAGAKPPG